VFEMEASKRGYLLTGRVESIVPYREADARVNARLENIYKINSGDTLQKKEIDRLSLLVKQRMDLFEKAINLYKESRYIKDSASTEQIKLLIFEGDLLMAQIRIQVNSMIAYEQYRVKQRVHTTDNFNNQAYIFIICFGLITIIVSLSGYIIVQRENKQK